MGILTRQRGAQVTGLIESPDKITRNAAGRIARGVFFRERGEFPAYLTGVQNGILEISGGSKKSLRKHHLSSRGTAWNFSRTKALKFEGFLLTIDLYLIFGIQT